MVEVNLFNLGKEADQKPSLIIVAPIIEISVDRGVLQVPSLDGKEINSWYFVEYEKDGSTYKFYQVDKVK